MVKIMSILNNSKVSEFMLPIGSFPVVNEQTIFKIALEKMSEFRLGIVCIIREKKLVGIITDGDISRMLLTNQKPFSAFFVDDSLKHANLESITISPNSNLTNAIQIMEEKQIWDIAVIDNNNNLVGLLHLHPIVKSLINSNE